MGDYSVVSFTGNKKPGSTLSHSHSHGSPKTPLTAEQRNRQRRAVMMMVVFLVPIAVFTIAGLIYFWPTNTSDHVREDQSTFSVPGLEIPTGVVTEIAQVNCDGIAGSTQDPTRQQPVCGNAKVKLLDGPEKGQVVDDITMTAPVYASGVKPGTKVTLFRVPTEGGPPQYSFADFERAVPLIALTAAFAVIVVLIARWRGFASLLGLAFAGFIMVTFMFPALISGSNPVWIGLIGSSAIMFVVLYAAHGFSARTTTALVGTLFGLFLSAALGYVASKWAHLTGAGTEDDIILSSSAPDLKLTSVVMCGVIIAGLGVLNDVTITQASAVWELAADSKKPDPKRLYQRAMRIGRDHIASTVYTIAFATVGAGLAVMLLLSVYQRPVLEVLQTEVFAAEIVRTLVGSIALMLAVPITTAVGVAVVTATSRDSKEIAIDPEKAANAPGDELTDVARSNRPAH